MHFQLCRDQLEETYLKFHEKAKADSHAYVEKFVKNADSIKPPTVTKTKVTLALTPTKPIKSKKRDTKAAEAAKLNRYWLTLASQSASSCSCG